MSEVRESLSISTVREFKPIGVLVVEENRDQQEPRKTNWSVTDKAAKFDRGELSVRNGPGSPMGSTELVPAGNTSILPAPSIAPPSAEGPLGILGRMKANKLSRNAAMQAIQHHYSSQLDVLAHSLAKSAQVKKSRADVMAEEYLKELDSQHLAVLTEFGLRNKETRERALIELTDMTASKLREIQEKDWPEELVRDTIVQLLGLRKRVVAEMMKELGGNYNEA